jgi:hypothetical protein
MIRSRSLGQTLFLLLAASLISSGCGDCSINSPCDASPIFDGFDDSRFDLALGIEDLDLTEVVPSQQFDHWELRHAWGFPGGRVVLASGGRTSTANLSALQLGLLDSLAATSGAQGCLFRSCSFHAFSLEGTNAIVWTGMDGFAGFLSGVDHPTEAILIAAVGGYITGGTDVRISGILQDNEGFLLLTRIVRSFCDPGETARVLLRISWDGMVSELADEIIKRTKRDDCPVI